MKHRRLLLGLAVFGCLLDGTTPCAADQTLRDRFLRDAPRGWEELQQAYDRVVGAGRNEAVSHRDGKIVQQVVFDFKVKQNGEWILWERSDPKTKSALAGGRNSSYAFSVSKAADKPWTLKSVNHDGTAVYWEARRGGGIAFFQSPWIILGRFSLSEIASDPSFKIRTLTEEVRDGHTLVVVQFDAAVKNAQPGWPPTELRHGRLVLDPSISWAMREGNVVLQPDSAKYTFSIDYDAPQKKIKKFHIENEQGSLTTKATFEVNELEFCAAPESDFTLSAYGIAEPKTPAKPVRWWLWIALAGGGLLVLGVGFAWWKRR